MAAGILIGLVLFAMVNAVVWLYSRGARYVPAPRASVRAMLALAEAGPGTTVYDLGSGDGRVLFIAAREFGARAVGIEVNPLRWLLTKLLIARHGLRDRVGVVRGDFFAQDLGAADVVVCYLSPPVIRQLVPRLGRMLRPGALVVAYRFPLVGLEPAKRDEDARVWLYRIGEEKPVSPATS